ncbi:type II secretion system protein GspC [Solimonas terrae]|uniref:Type II secretion system protein GspC n=1 Tax=Solimonas terrae TaxID=1396819 RepID=A0A6M2BX95_9GAMM|nr:type II secretion system protein GspC [Solimonas terrae]NGY06801.1 type II secretion system protein GspC [Solimonas terrae]
MTSSLSLQPFARLYEQHGRKLPPVAVLLLVIVIAWLSARLVWALIPTPAAARWQAPTLPAQQATSHRQTDVQGIVDHNLFGVYQAVPDAQSAAEAPETRLSLTLIGILSATQDRESRALIGSSNGDEKPYAIGDDVIRGVSLQAIFPDRVILSRDGSLETLRLNKDAPSTATAGAPPSSVPSGTAQMLTQIRDEVLTDPSKASQYIRVQPANVNGQLKGFRVYPGRERGAFNQLGLRPGDLVTQVNGIQLDDSQKALQMLTELSKANSVSLTVERGGQTQNFNVTLN